MFKGKRFITLFEKTENFHLIKDVGQIPYLLHYYFRYDSTIVSYKNSDDYPYLDREVKGLKLKFIPRIKFERYSVSALIYLFFNAKKIDVLHLFHHREKTYLNFLMYKWRNPKGIAFLKSDIPLKTITEEYNGLIPDYILRKWLFSRVLPKLDIISVETEEAYSYLRERYALHQEKFIFLPNGINLDRMYALVPPREFEDKENIILTVGRIGAPEKNNEMLLKAIEKLPLEDWKVVFIGPIEKEFESVMENFFQKNPHLREKVLFLGAIYDRQSLFEWYAKSKIFCLTSIEESFGFVLIEAMAYSNYVVTTAISSANEITGSGKAGAIIVTEEELAKQLERLMHEQDYLKQGSSLGALRVRERFDWVHILALLDNFITIKSEK